MVDLQPAEHAPSEQGQWLSLGEACRLLQVKEGTLRHWADLGHLRVYRTPGGHRRFSREDVLSLTKPPAKPAPASGEADSRERLEGSALRRIRRRLTHEDVARQSWYQSVEEEGRDRMRLFGRRLLSLLLQESQPRRRRQETLEEAVMLGHEYGAEMADRAVPLKDTVEAFVFFRTMVLDSANAGSWTHVLEIADQVLVGIVESYQKRLDRNGA
jgi:excisionase family DNA binding protein